MFRAWADGHAVYRQPRWLLKSGVGVEKVPQERLLGCEDAVPEVFVSRFGYVMACRAGVADRLRKRTSRLMFWAAAARKKCSRTNFNRRRRRRRNPIRFFSSANKASTFFLCRWALTNSGVLANSRARCRAGSRVGYFDFRYKCSKYTGAMAASTAATCRASTHKACLGARGSHFTAKNPNTGSCPAISSCQMCASAPSSG